MNTLSQIEVANAALVQIGESPITSFTDATQKADTISRLYVVTRDEVLRQCFWQFARKFATCADLGSTSGNYPLYDDDFTNGFALPSDFVRIVGIEDSVDFMIYNYGNGLAIASNESTCKIEYIARVTNEGLWDELFTATMIARLASRLAMALVHSFALSQEFLVEYKDLLADARAVNGQDQRRPKFVESNVLIDVRGAPYRRPDRVLGRD